jgi:hypothetical protein
MLPALMTAPAALPLLAVALGLALIWLGLVVAGRTRNAVALLAGSAFALCLLLGAYLPWTVRHPGGQLVTFVAVHHFDPLWLMVPTLVGAVVAAVALRCLSGFRVPRTLGGPAIRFGSGLGVVLLAAALGSLTRPVGDTLAQWGGGLLAVRLGVGMWHASIAGGALWRPVPTLFPTFKALKMPMLFVICSVVLMLLEGLIFSR